MVTVGSVTIDTHGVTVGNIFGHFGFAAKMWPHVITTEHRPGHLTQCLVIVLSVAYSVVLVYVYAQVTIIRTTYIQAKELSH